MPTKKKGSVQKEVRKILKESKTIQEQQFVYEKQLFNAISTMNIDFDLPFSLKGSPMALGQRLFNNMIRNRVEARLRRKGLNKAQIKEKMAEVDDTLIESCAEHEQVKVSAIGDGGFLEWLIEHGPQIQKIIELILAALGL